MITIDNWAIIFYIFRPIGLNYNKKILLVVDLFFPSDNNSK